jgi:hypothetical protein
LIIIATLALIGGFLFEWKSAWCAGMCPVHPVERLYGGEPFYSFPNAHCTLCKNCVVSCPDVTPGIFPLTHDKEKPRQYASILLVGGFPGFVWGWYHVPNYHGGEGWNHLETAYGWPFLGLLITLSLYLFIQKFFYITNEIRLIRGFAACAIIVYYWYRIPALFGFSIFPGDGLLIDLTNTLPSWFPYLSRFVTTSFFVWWMVLRLEMEKNWIVRPPFKQPKKEAMLEYFMKDSGRNFIPETKAEDKDLTDPEWQKFLKKKN